MKRKQFYSLTTVYWKILHVFCGELLFLCTVTPVLILCMYSNEKFTVYIRKGKIVPFLSFLSNVANLDSLLLMQENW